MLSSLLLASLSALLALAAAQNTSSEHIVDLGYARYRGIQNDSYPNIVNYYGIRYAAPPLGELRWRAPMDIESHGGYDRSAVMDATKRGPKCVQGVPYWRQTIEPSGEEDCLLLDVLVPKMPASEALPVMVQIHGGGYLQGNSQSSPGYALVNASRDNLIYISIQYRLSTLGFLSSAEIHDNGAPNAGLLDQRAALNWIQRHARDFGGDPAKVTIIGGSAGGGSVMDQMIMYGGVASPPFRAAVAEYPWWQSYKNGTVLQAQYRQMLDATRCLNLECLRNQTTEDLIRASQVSFDVGFTEGWYGHGDFYYGPSVDGNVIRDLPSNEFKQGHFTKVPLIVNRDAYEGYNYSPHDNTTEQMTADLQTIFPFAKASFFKRLYQLYPASDFNSTFFRRAEIYGDYIINCPTYHMATALSDWGMPVWKFIFSAGSQLHGADQPFLFGPESGEEANNATIAAVLKDYYLGFAIDLDPNSVNHSGVSKPEWPQYSTPSLDNGEGGFTILDFNYTMIGTNPDRDASARCDFFHGQSYVVRN